MVVISSTKKIDLELCDEVWYITNNTPNIKIGCTHVPELAPLSVNYKKFRRGLIDRDKLLFGYRMQLEAHEETMKAVDKLIREATDKWIQVVCYCDDATECHRSVLYRHLHDKGVSVQLLN